MRKKILLLGFLLSFFASVQSQTTLSAGDIAIIGVNYDTSPNYELTIVTLVPIAANTQIYISDYWYNESTPNKLTNVQASTGNALTSEGAILWTTDVAIPAGTVYKISIVQGGNSVTGLPGTVSVTGWSTPTGTPSSQGGDNWFIYQGTSVTDVTNFVFLWGNGSPRSINAFTVTPGEFVPSGSGNLSSNGVTYLPPSLTLGTNAIALTVDPAINSGVGFHADNNVYIGTESDTKASILAAICNKNNWTRSETTTYDISPSGTNFSGTNPIFTITGLNTAPTDIALSTNASNENVAANSTVGTLSSTDADSGNTFTYSLVAGTGSTDNASFNISGSNLRITASPDFETKSSYAVRIRTTDQGGLTFEKAFTITINDINEAPTDIVLSASAINENVAANSTVGSFSSTDADSGNTFTYTLVAGTGSTDNASFNISGSNLRITASPDFETKSSYSVRIRTTDQGSLTFEKAFTITINDVNEAPTDIVLTTSAINENVAANSTVGSFSSTDADSGNAFTYTLVAGTGSTDNASFNISGSNLRITATPDFETKSSYSVRIRTADQGSLTFEKALTITINDVNETPTDIAMSASSIDENVAANSTVGTLSSTDADSANTFSYNLVAGTGSTDNASFNISGSSLRITASPDFETKSSYSIRIRTTDQGSLTFEKAFTITINDLSDINQAPTDITLSASAINENVPANSTVGALSSTDVDTSSFTYSLVAGAGDTDNAAFSISGSDLKITASPDFETKASYSVRVRTFDGTSTFEKAFTITINDVNEAPTDIALSASAIDENVAANSTVGALSSTDLDTSAFTYSLVPGAGDTDNASFSISGSDLKITASPDFETKASYSVRVRTFDGTSTFEKAFTITINDVNEAPTDIALSASAIDENVAANSTVGALSSTDLDTSAFTYSLVPGAGDTDNASFSISGSDLKITTSPDFETKASYSVRVRTFDGTSTFEKALTISINDVNEAPTDITLSASAIDENVAANATIGTLSSTDVDTSAFTYSLVPGTGDTDNASFSISGSDLKITASPDFETKSSYSVRVRTFDGTSTFEKAFTISINDVNEAPTDITLSAAAIDENVAANSTVGALSSTDVDTSSFTYSLVAGAGDTDNASFSISGSDLKITASPDFETKASYAVRVRTFDGTSTFEKAFTITINDVNEAPTDITLSAAAIDENVVANSTVGALSSTDVDTSAFTYSLVAGAGDTDNASFSISGSDLKITASPDFETQASYAVRVRTFDGTSTFEKAFTITINDVNEAPTDITLSASAIDENVAANSTVGALSSTDLDTSSFTYSLVAGAGDTDNASFSISGSDFKITASPDFETKSSYSVRVRTFDGTSTFEKAFTISINDVNEAPTDITLSAAAIDENVAANSTVGALSSTDLDTSAFTYSLVPGAGDTDNASFSISGSDLNITASPDFETKASYSVRIRTFDGTSTFEKVFAVTVNNLCDIVLTAASQTNIACNGGSTGAATVNAATGGTGPYTYNWTPGNPTGDGTVSVTGLTPGVWTCTVTDNMGCSTTLDFTITQPTAISTATAAQTNVSCNGGSNGSASVTPSGGAGGYTYSWSPSGGTAATATGLSAGTYTVTITDGFGCTATRSFTITQPTVISTATAAQTNVSCNGGSNGSASVTPSGGAGGYTYSWSPSGGTAATATGLSAGTYTVTVTDANGCAATRNFTITQPTVISTATAAQTNVSCNGGSNGSASVTPSGGAGGYTYSWSPSGGTAATATGLSAGTYTVTVTDANGCAATRNFTITQPTAIDFTTTVLSGYDYNTGYSQTIVASGGTGSKTYAVTAGSLPTGFSLSTAGQITGISTQIADSNFTVTTTDANSCTATYDYVLKLNQIPITVTATPSQTKVYGESDPVLTYTVSPSLLPGDSFTGSLIRVSGENIGNYAINQGSLSAGSKYLITYAGTNFTITAKPITVTATPSQTKVYGATDPIFDYTVSPSLVGSDALTGALTRVAGENIGTYTINQGSLSAGSNYTISYTGTNFTITAKPITVTATPSQTKVYGTANPVYSYTVSPSLVSGDSFIGTLTRTAGESIGNYAITQGSLSAGSNYTITYVSKDFVVTGKPITVTADASQTKVYGTANPIYSYTVSPSLVSGDSFTGTLNRTAGENIGNYAITQGSLSAGSNYTITYVSKDFTITAKPITVTANASQTKVYGTTNPIYSYTVSPSLVSGDSFTGALTRAAGENVGVYAITQGTLSAGGNYTIMFNGSDFTITKADQVITWNQTLGLGCNGETSLILTAVSNSGLAVNYTSSNPTIASVANNSLFFQNYGSATITASQPGDMNYNAAPNVVLPVVTSQPNLIRKQFENIIFFDNSSRSFKAYSWYKNGVLVASQTSQYFKESGALNGTYYAVAIKLDGTSITTCPLTLSPTVEEEYIRIVPNPVRSNANFQLITNVSSSKLQNARIELYNLTGSLLTTITNPSQNTIEMLAPNAQGIYIVKMTLANGKYFTKNLLVKN